MQWERLKTKRTLAGLFVGSENHVLIRIIRTKTESNFAGSLSHYDQNVAIHLMSYIQNKINDFFIFTFTLHSALALGNHSMV
ncbi:MAG: hypothetical protein ACRC4N_00435, partial [Gammaproteobacteria bacterium]